MGGTLLALLVAVAIGVVAGLVAGYYKGWFDLTSQWATNLLMGLPGSSCCSPCVPRSARPCGSPWRSSAC